MEELEIPTETPKTSLLNKRITDLTVADQLKLVVIVPVLTVGGMIAAGAAVTGVSSLASKIRNRKDRKGDKKDSTTPVEATSKSK